MDNHEQMEFWKGLGRLYDETLALRESIDGLRAIAQAQQNGLRSLQSACEALLEVSQSHEQRLARLEEKPDAQ